MNLFFEQDVNFLTYSYLFLSQLAHSHISPNIFQVKGHELVAFNQRQKNIINTSAHLLIFVISMTAAVDLKYVLMRLNCVRKWVSLSIV